MKEQNQLPQVRALAVRDLQARARLMDEGIDLTQPLPVDKAEPERCGHGSTARRSKHIRDGEKPCRACEDAFDRWRYPNGHDRPLWDDLWDRLEPA